MVFQRLRNSRNSNIHRKILIVNSDIYSQLKLDWTIVVGYGQSLWREDLITSFIVRVSINLIIKTNSAMGKAHGLNGQRAYQTIIFWTQILRG